MNSGSSASRSVSLFSILAIFTISSSFSQRETTTVATPLPTRLVKARASDMNRSIPKISASPATGMVGIAAKVAAKVMKPLPVTPAAPLEVSISTPRIVKVWVQVRGVLVACATKTAAMVR